MHNSSGAKWSGNTRCTLYNTAEIDIVNLTYRFVCLSVMLYLMHGIVEVIHENGVALLGFFFFMIREILV